MIGKLVLLAILIVVVVHVLALIAWALVPEAGGYSGALDWTIDNLLDPSQITADSTTPAGRVVGIIVILVGLVLILGGILAVFAVQIFQTQATGVSDRPIPGLHPVSDISADWPWD